MAEHNITKNIGISWGEIDGRVIEYAANDPKAGQDVRDKVAEAYSKFEEADHIPITSFVLQDIPEETKEAKLQTHSEKLVLAEFLLHTGKQTPIKIVKNLRK